MNQETFNMSIRSFLKKVGVTSQQKIEQAVADAVMHGKLIGNERLPIRMQLTIDAIQLDVEFDDLLDLGASS
jgi:hypothetical protein